MHGKLHSGYSWEFTMIRRKVLRICPGCKKEEMIRVDAVGIYCRRCRALINSKNNIGKYEDITNNRFGKLVAIRVSHQIDKLYYWKCICDCGNEKIISGNRLRSGKTKSCGCIVKVQNGLSKTAAYRSWDAMIQRCYDSTVAHYKNYGLRGIEVCESWRQSFLSFLNDMGDRPEGKTLDRINNEGNYTKENCKWSTGSEQALNRRKNAKVK
jgi:hypothetical protein